MRPQRRCFGIRTSASHHIGDEPLVAGHVLACDHRRLRHIGMSRERRLDLARLDAVAAQLQLRIGAAEEFQNPVGAPARAIAAAIHPAPRSSERVGHEPLGGEPGTPEIAACQPRPRNVKLARNTCRHRREPSIENVDAVVGKRAADRDALLVGCLVQNKRSRIDAALGRAVGIGNRHLAKSRAQQTMKRDWRLLSPENDSTERDSGRGRRDHRRQERRRRIHIVHGMPGHEFPECGWLVHLMVSHQHDASTMQQRQQFLLDRRVETDRRNSEHTIAGSHRKICHLRASQIGNAPMRHGHAFRRSGGSRRVDDISGV
jgi:hypothetical protein